MYINPYFRQKNENKNKLDIMLNHHIYNIFGLRYNY